MAGRDWGWLVMTGAKNRRNKWNETLLFRFFIELLKMIAAVLGKVPLEKKGSVKKNLS